ncbi:MAG: 4-hydroxy-tetrahydrodipicolinate synthase [Bacteroidales bacterium]|nr:4-hydroxy-tetrahydrodipicolinate synthase [Bacteroidales bacterium]
MKTILKGTGVALITPFRRYGTVDFNSLNRLIENVIDNGVDFLVVMGTTGEAATLSEDERNAIISFTVENVNKRLPIVLGVGGNNTQHIVDVLKSDGFNGVDAILSVAPYYNKPGQKGIYSHYKAIAAASHLPVILYNVPGRTSVNIEADTCLKLANDFDNIIGIKEASGNISQCMQILKNRPKDFLLFSGDDLLTYPLMALGADGVISVVANALPKQFSDMVNLMLKKNYNDALKIHYKLIDFINLLFVEGNPAGVKAALEILGLINNNLRLPLTKVSKLTYSNLSNSIKEILDSEK